jgi:exopolysaccharide production protein ExoQ
MYDVIADPVEPVQQARIYLRPAVGLLYCLILAFLYPFAMLINGIDPSVPVELQTTGTMTIYYLRFALPMLCVGIALACGKSNFFLHLSPALLFYCALSFLSVAWSEDQYASLKSAVRLSEYVIAIAALCEVLELEILCRALLNIFAFAILASVAMAILAPAYATHQASDAAQGVHAGLWRGVFGHKNDLGAMASAATIALLCFGGLGSSLPGFRFICVVASLACLIFAGSAGAIASLLVGLMIYFLIFLTRRWPVAFTWFFVLIVAAALAGVLLAADVDTFALLGRDVTLTGRTSIWDTVLAMIADSPLLGHGYYAGTWAFARPRLSEYFGPAISDAHSGYLSILLETGVVGLSLYLYLVLSVIFMGIAQAKRESRVRRNCFMLLLVSPILSLVFAFFEEHPVVDTGCIGALNFFSLVAAYSYLKQSEGRLEVAREPEAGRDVS